MGEEAPEAAAAAAMHPMRAGEVPVRAGEAVAMAMLAAVVMGMSVKHHSSFLEAHTDSIST